MELLYTAWGKENDTMTSEDCVAVSLEVKHAPTT